MSQDDQTRGPCQPSEDARDESTSSQRFFQPVDAESVVLHAASPPERIGRYRVVRIIGEGGMGMVLEAEQDKPRRIVALKVIRPGVASAEMLRRFELESEMLGLLQHPGIAQVHEAGVFESPSGAQPYFAMEFIRGKPLTTYAREHNLGTRERLQLMIKVCEAVQHAHQKGVIHRDLKPSNILVVDDELPSREAHGLQSVGVAASARQPQPKILDFGVARLTASDIQSTTLRTDIGQLIGTIPYMSPEQTDGDPRMLDTRSDVYALGVICYELLADRLPYDMQHRMIHEAVRVIREDDPTPLSSVNRFFRGDVETIVAKALEKDRERRYQSATELAADIERYLKDEAIVARPAGQMYRVKKFARRNKVLVGGVATTMLALAAGLIASLALLQKANAAWESESKALHAEKERADELDKLATFQAAQLSGIDAKTMGVKLRADILERKREHLKNAKHEGTVINADFEQLEKSLAGVNFTNIALKSLHANVFTRAIKSIDTQFADQELVKARLLQTVAATMRDVGLLEEAPTAQREALAIRRRELGDQHPDTLASMSEMGTLLLLQGHDQEAEPYLLGALTGFRRVLGEEHRDTVNSISNMGTLRLNQGNYPDAERYFREALEKARRALGEEHLTTLTSIGNMGFVLQEQERIQESETYYREALEKSRRILGDEHPYTLNSINNMGTLLHNMGRVEEAEQFVREALESCRRILGDEHPDTLSAINNMGFLLMEQGKTSLAESYYREALENSRRILGDEHPDTLNSINNMGFLLHDQNRLPEAELCYRDALEKRRRILGDEHPDTLISINSMALLLQDQGKYPEAELCYREVLEKRRRLLGDDNPDTLISMFGLEELMIRSGKFIEAEPLGIECLERNIQLFGLAHPNTIGATRILVKLYNGWHAAEPGKGYDLKAAEWKTKLAELQAATQPASQSASPTSSPTTLPAAP